MNHGISIDRLLHLASGAVYAEEHAGEKHPAKPGPPQPFITISRQYGARGRSLAAALAERLNAIDPAEQPWTVWDRELVEKVVAERHISPNVIEAMEGPRHTWIQDLLSAFSSGEPGSYLGDREVFLKVAATARALAVTGRVILVGRGGVYATSDLPVGIHVRLIAPLESRIAFMTGELKLSPRQAAAEVKRIDEFRDAFHRRCCTGKATMAEMFTITFNSAKLTDEEMAACVVPLLHIHEKHHVTSY